MLGTNMKEKRQRENSYLVMANTPLGNLFCVVCTVILENCGTLQNGYHFCSSIKNRKQQKREVPHIEILYGAHVKVEKKKVVSFHNGYQRRKMNWGKVKKKGKSHFTEGEMREGGHKINIL